MTPRRLLSQTAEHLSVGQGLDPTTRRPSDVLTTVATGIRCAARKRADRTVVYDETGAVVTDYDVVLEPVEVVPKPGDLLRINGTPAGDYTVTGEPRQGVRRTTGTTIVVSVPCRRIGL